jgi:hypothetical protein
MEWFFDHPRFGVIPCERTTRFVAAGEELFLDYEYDPYNCPDWFREAIIQVKLGAGNTKGGSITVPLTSCLTGLESAV